MSARIATLDGLRGILALLVFTAHATDAAWLKFPSTASVWVFFALSGYVLAPTYDGRWLAFMARRYVRLWPMLALCIAAGGVATGARGWSWQALLIPYPSLDTHIDGPAWSLYVEFWIGALMPVVVWTMRGSALRLALMMAVSFIAGALVDRWLLYLMFFCAGAWATRWRPRLAILETAVPQWLGRISYPLYLCHSVVLHDFGLPLWASVPLALIMAEGLAQTIEPWSIAASRSIGRRTG